MRTVTATADDRLQALWAAVDKATRAALVIGAAGALAGWSPGAWILVPALGAQLAGHLAISVLAYRRTMRREWPRVEPLPDDDW